MKFESNRVSTFSGGCRATESKLEETKNLCFSSIAINRRWIALGAKSERKPPTGNRNPPIAFHADSAEISRLEKAKARSM
jgi:hypothetical protein